MLLLQAVEEEDDFAVIKQLQESAISNPSDPSVHFNLVIVVSCFFSYFIHFFLFFWVCVFR